MTPEGLWREVLYRAEKYGWAKQSESKGSILAEFSAQTKSHRTEHAEAELKSAIIAWAREGQIK